MIYEHLLVMRVASIEKLSMIIVTGRIFGFFGVRGFVLPTTAASRPLHISFFCKEADRQGW